MWFACISVKKLKQIQESYASACVQEESPLLGLFAHLPVLSIQRALEGVSFKRIPFIISRTPGHPVPPPREQPAIE